MAVYNPPTEDLPIFDSSVFESNNAGLTIGEGDLRYLRWPVSQGSESITGDLNVSGTSTLGLSTLDGATFQDMNPQYSITYPVNSGQFEFWTNTAGGASTNGGVIDATGVYSISDFDTIDKVAGVLDIGTAALRTGSINIGTGASASKGITIGNTSGAFGTVDIGTTTITIGKSNTATNSINTSSGGTLNLKSGATGGTINIGTSMTGGTIDIATATSSSTAINIGTGSGDKSIILGLAGTTTSSLTRLRGYQIDLNPALGGILNLGTFMTSGTIEIGTANSSSTQIDIGTGTTIAKQIRIGNADIGTTFLRGATLTLNAAAATGAINMGTFMTGGTIDIGQSGASTSSTTIAIGNGSNQTGAINIGTGTATSKSITIGNVSGAFGTLNLGCASISIANAANTTALLLGSGMTSGTIAIGAPATTSAPFYLPLGGGLSLNSGGVAQSIDIGANQTSGVLNIGTGASRTGAITIGTSGQNTSLTLNGITITIGDSGTTGGISLGVPLRPNYLPSAITATTQIGHIATPASTSLTQITTGTGNVAQFSLGVGVWDVQVRVRMTNFVSTAKNFFRFSLSTTSGTQSTYVNDWLADNADGAFNFLVNGKFSLSATTTIYVVGSCGGGIGTAPVTATTNADVQAMRVA